MNSENPWLSFEFSDRMVHHLDEKIISSHNASSKPEYQFLLNLAPEPWIGNLNGNLLVLYSNPGATKENLSGNLPQKYEKVIEKSINNLQQKNFRYPHFHFDPDLVDTEGAKWYIKKYQWLIKEVGQQVLSKNLITCEVCPYHSFRWKIPKILPPTQKFTFKIVEEAIDRGATILLARSAQIWLEYVPKLSAYPKVFRPNSINASISPGNYGDNFHKILSSFG